MKQFFALFLIVMAVGFSACGSSGGGTSDTCTFDVNGFTNGANAQSIDSVWNCRTTGSSGTYTFAFYDDGTGVSSAIDAFTWDEVGCAAVDIVASNGDNQIRDISGSVASGIATFTQIHPSGSESTSSCTIGTVSAQTRDLVEDTMDELETDE